MRLLLSALALCLAPTASAQNLITPRDTFLNMMAHASEDPGHALWFYVSGLVGGANAISILNTGKPIICDTHRFEEIRKTEDLIMDWLVRTDQLSNPDILLEFAVPLAFADAYPCTST